MRRWGDKNIGSIPTGSDSHPEGSDPARSDPGPNRSRIRSGEMGSGPDRARWEEAKYHPERSRSGSIWKPNLRSESIHSIEISSDPILIWIPIGDLRAPRRLSSARTAWSHMVTPRYGVWRI